jgi:hypothetical protein
MKLCSVEEQLALTMLIQQIKRNDSAFQQPVNENELRLRLVRELSGEKVIEVTELKIDFGEHCLV